MLERRSRKEFQDAFVALTLVAAGPSRVEVSQLFFYILQHPERVLFPRRGHTVGHPYRMDGHCRYTLDPSACFFGSFFLSPSGSKLFPTSLIYDCTIIIPQRVAGNI